jgi:hypothetical protein
MRDSFIIYRSFFEAIKQLPKEDQANVWAAVCDYSLNFTEPELSGISSVVFTLIKPQLDANNKRFKNGTKGGRFGKKGGNPKLTPSKPLSNPKTTPNNNVNVNVNVNDNQNNNINVNPALKDVEDYFDTNGYTIQAANKFYNYYSVANWKDSKGKQVKNWKQKAQSVWFRDEYLKPKAGKLPNDFCV